jgi:GNAT superfamily N-acetyltransferase
MTDLFRRMSSADIPAALRLSTEAGWNQTANDWQMLLELAPDGCFVIEIDGTLAATTTLLCHGQKLAWIGMVLTTEKYQGRGFARRLITEALAQADRRQIESVKLDATDQGRPIYEKMGFRFEQSVERWSRSGTDNFVAIPKPVTNFVGDSFEADRSQLLHKLAARHSPLTLDHSWLFTRAGRHSAYLGPAVCENLATARRLFEQVSGSAWYWDLPPSNGDAVVLAKELGFSPERKLSRMVRGKDLRGKEDAIYAIAGFELG